MWLQNNFNLVMELAERHYDRIDPVSFLGLLPKQIAIADIAKYLNIVLEYSSHNKRNLQVSSISD